MKIAAISHEIHIADCEYNAERIIESAKAAHKAGCSVAVFPAFAITGCSCGDLFSTENLKESAKEALLKIARAGKDLGEMVIVLGFYVSDERCIALIKNGEIIKLISENRPVSFSIDDEYFRAEATDPVGIIEGYSCIFKYAPEHGHDIQDNAVSLNDTGISHDTDFIFLLLSGEMYAGCSYDHLHDLALLSHKYHNTVIGISTGAGESVDECVYSGLKLVARDGVVYDYTYKNGIWIFDHDMEAFPSNDPGNIDLITDRTSFLPSDEAVLRQFCFDIMKIQAVGLGERLKFLSMKKVMLGLSGGLDSTLALIAAVNAFDRYSLDRKGIICVTMPGYGTGMRTKGNAVSLAEIFGVTLKTIDIREQVKIHLQSIDHPVDENGDFVSNVTFENAQARVRTMILMNMANNENAIVVGTGDMSELALGWCTYNGDHMSNYSVNAGVPKTVIAPVLRTYVECVAKRDDREELSRILEDIIDTPVSPELLPTDKDGNVVQNTEDSLGPYELHDFFLYRFLNHRYESTGFIFEFALNIFCGENGSGNKYDRKCVYETFKTFIRRFFSQQFKRSCMPVGPKVFKHSLSPRSGFLFPGDAYATVWLNELEEAKEALL